MAYHFAPPSHYPANLPAAPINPASCAVPTPLVTNTRSSLRAPNIKEELLHSVEQHREVEAGTEVPPSKRQKTTENGNKHKFVSQKKWTFSMAQPWVPSKVSSKAQNASKTSSVSKKESSSPDSSPPPLTVSQVVNDHPSRTGTWSFGAGGQYPYSTPSYTLEESGQTTAHIPQSSVRGKSSSRQRLSMQALPVSHAPLSPDRSRGSISTFSMQKRDIQRQKTSTDMMHPSSHESIVPVLSRTRSSRTLKAFSLEKDAERIAALIAEKKKENESSMFRERMLQKQLEHKNQQDDRRKNGDILEIGGASPSASPSDIQNTATRDRGKGSPTEQSSSISPALCGTAKRQLHCNQATITSVSHPQESLALDQLTRPPRQAVPGSSDLSQIADEALPAPLPAALQLRKQKPGYSEHADLFGTNLAINTPTRGHQTVIHTANKRTSMPSLVSKGGIPFEADHVSMPAQLVSFGSQFVPQYAVHNTQNQTARNTRLPRSQYTERQKSNPVLVTQPQIRQHTGSRTSMIQKHPVEILVNTGSASASTTSLQSPTAASAEQFLHLGISEQPHQPTTGYAAAMSQSRVVSVAQMPTGVTPYHEANRSLWTSGAQQAMQSNTSGLTARPSLPLALQNNALTTSLAAQQHSIHPPVSTADVNIFNGNARLNGGNGYNRAAAKPRVNMFSNTKGTPFPVHEVIRQIEMT